MKSLRLSFGLIVLFLLTACSKDGLIPGDQTMSPDQQAIDARHGQCGTVIHVPAPNGTDDTEVLLKAFEDAIDAGPGTVVQLAVGKYIIGFLEVHEFEGVFTGAGKGKSVITNKPNLPCEEKWQEDIMPSLITFIGGNMIMSHMTIHTQDGLSCEPSAFNDLLYGELTCGVTFADFSGKYASKDMKIKACVENVEFIAGDDGGYGVYKTPGNVAMWIFCGASFLNFPTYFKFSDCDITIRNCYFENGITGPDAYSLSENGIFTVENNVMNACAQQVFAGGVMGGSIDIHNNKFINCTYNDIMIWESDFGIFSYVPDRPTKAAEIKISGNIFDSPEGVISLFLRDDFRSLGADAPAQHFAVFNNFFRTSPGVPPYPNQMGLTDAAQAFQAFNLKDALIFNNRFSGSGKFGILVDGDEVTGIWAEGNKLIGNYFHHTDYSEGTVYLGPYSRNCKIIGVSKDAVVDDGTDNLIIGPKFHRSMGVPQHHHYFRPQHGGQHHFGRM